MKQRNVNFIFVSKSDKKGVQCWVKGQKRSMERSILRDEVYSLLNTAIDQIRRSINLHLIISMRSSLSPRTKNAWTKYSVHHTTLCAETSSLKKCVCIIQVEDQLENILDRYIKFSNGFLNFNFSQSGTRHIKRTLTFVYAQPCMAIYRVNVTMPKGSERFVWDNSVLEI